jgi:hypothetical protein
MAKLSLRTAAICCLAIWAAIWLVFLLIRLSTLDVRSIPGAGMTLLGALLVALVAPIMAAALAGWALFRQPKAPLNLLIFACAIGAFLGQVLLFLVSKLM